MGILKTINRHFDAEQPNSLVSYNRAINVLSRDNEFIEEVLNCFAVTPEIRNHPLTIGNVSPLFADIQSLDEQDWKIDIPVPLRNIDLVKVLPNDYALFRISGIKDAELIKTLQADNLEVESRYSARSDLLDYYSLSKFASFLHDHNLDAYARTILDHLHTHLEEQVSCSARLLYHKEDAKYYLRAVTSEKGYKDYGINFSVLVALLAIDAYAKVTQDSVFIDSYSIDDSRVSLSFQFAREIPLRDGMSLSLNLLLENDEIRQSSVSLNAIFKVKYGEDGRSLFFKPTAYQKKDGEYSTDMLTYTHGMKVSTVYERISTLPLLISKYAEQIRSNATEILKITNPQETKNYLLCKIQRSRKEEFLGYKTSVIQRIISMEVNTVYDLFDLLRNVEELFGEDIMSRNYWRENLYNALIEKGRRD